MPLDLYAPRIVVAAGMQGTGVSTIAEHMQEIASSLTVVEGGARWADILEACMPGFERMLIVTTHDIVAVSSAYALVKIVRDRFSDARIEVVVNMSEARDALKTYERIQVAASHFLQETVGYAGAIPFDPVGDSIPNTGTVPGNVAVGDDGLMAIQNIAVRLDDELGSMDGRVAHGAMERRLTR